MPNTKTTVILSTVEHRYRRFAHEYLTGGFNATKAYKSVYGESLDDRTAAASASRLLTNGKVQAILERLAEESWGRSGIEREDLLGAWKSMMDANVMDFLEVAQDGPFAGSLVLRKGLESLPRHIQQNLRRLKIRSTVRELPDGSRVHSQWIDVEIVDRVAVLRDMARWLGLTSGHQKSGANVNLAKQIRRGQERVKAARASLP